MFRLGVLLHVVVVEGRQVTNRQRHLDRGVVVEGRQVTHRQRHLERGVVVE